MFIFHNLKYYYHVRYRIYMLYIHLFSYVYVLNPKNVSKSRHHVGVPPMFLVFKLSSSH